MLLYKVIVCIMFVVCDVVAYVCCVKRGEDFLLGLPGPKRVLIERENRYDLCEKSKETKVRF